MRKIVATLLLALTVLSPAALMAQDGWVVRGDCTPAPVDDGSRAASRGPVRRLPAVSKDWNPMKAYRQLVVLFSFSDTDFKMAKPLETYDSIFNEPGYNQRNGAGCVADYFRAQSGGMLNLQFDVYGPYKVSSKAQPYESPDADTRNYGREQMREAAQMLLKEHPELDYTVYDWNGDGNVNQVIYVYAGLSGNENRERCYGHIWPNTSSFPTLTTPGGKRISNYTASAELWDNGSSCGLGTVCHEFTHSLGLPDIYPKFGSVVSCLDEWDLMDGGNFTNYGWCPPNYTPMEKMLLGWLEPVELIGPASIEGMKTVDQGGEVYRISHTEDEYYLLENRQWDGWDAGLPGRGLVVYHVNYADTRWSNNTVNISTIKPGFTIVCADNLSYDEWVNRLLSSGVTTQNALYQNPQRMNSKIMSTAAYPWTTDSTDFVNNQLTDVSVPAAKMFNNNAENSKLLSKTLTNIKVSDDGLVSFDFMGGTSDIVGVRALPSGGSPAYYDLSGCRRSAPAAKGIVVIRQADGTVRKQF